MFGETEGEGLGGALRKVRMLPNVARLGARDENGKLSYDRLAQAFDVR
jgi:hypothetical protein